MSDTLPSFAVVIPMYNEEIGAERCVAEVCTVLSTLTNKCTLIVVEDGGRDNTKNILEQIREKYSPLKIVFHEKNKGYGAALRTGAVTATADGYDYVLFMDSDLTNSPKDIPRFADKMKEGFDVIKATRYSSGGSLSGVPFYRVAISRVGNIIAHLLFGLPIYDCTNGFRAVRTDLFGKMTLTENNFSVIMEELYFQKYLTSSFCEIPVVLTNRADDLRPTSFAYRPSIFYDYLKYPLKAFFVGNPFNK